MRLLIQRVLEAKVIIDSKIISEVGLGMVLFLGIHKQDLLNGTAHLANKAVNMRIFSNSSDKLDLSINEVNGSILVVSQFTLYADYSKGRRPSFPNAADPEVAEKIYHQFIKDIQSLCPKVFTGVFGADMQIQMVNNGPLTFILET